MLNVTYKVDTNGPLVYDVDGDEFTVERDARLFACAEDMYAFCKLVHERALKNTIVNLNQTECKPLDDIIEMVEGNVVKDRTTALQKLDYIRKRCADGTLKSVGDVLAALGRVSDV